MINEKICRNEHDHVGKIVFIAELKFYALFSVIEVRL